jgi:hypothetical protein
MEHMKLEYRNSRLKKTKTFIKKACGKFREYEEYCMLFKQTTQIDEKLKYHQNCFECLRDFFQLFNENEILVKNEIKDNNVISALYFVNEIRKKRYDTISSYIDDEEYPDLNEFKEIFESILKNMDDFARIYEF